MKVALSRLSSRIDLAPRGQRVYRPEAVRAIAKAAGHQVLFLPPYSPDFNQIEHDFAALKRILAYSPEGTTLNEVVANY